MLTWMRRQSGRMWVKVLMVAVAITFFGGFGLLSSSRIQNCMGVEDQSGTAVLASIDGKNDIIERDYLLRYHQNLRRIQSRLSEQYPDQPIPDDAIDYDRVREDTMKNLIEHRLLLMEAERLNLSVSNEEMKTEIVNFYLSMSKETSFNLEGYRKLLRAIGFDEPTFEGMMREDLQKAKVLDLINQGVGVLPDEVRERYAFDHEKVKLDYVVLDPAVTAPEAMPSEQAVKDYFDKKAGDYYLGETRRIEYVSWSAPDLMSGISVSDAEIASYYEGSKDRYQEEPEKVHALQILIKYDQVMESEEAKQKALARINEIRTEALAAGADFGELAKKHSESATKDSGGDLGWFVRAVDKQAFPDFSSMEPEIEDAAFKLKIDEISEPVLTQFGFNLIKLVDRMDARYRELADIRPEVEQEVRHIKAMDLADQKAATLRKLVAGTDFTEAAKSQGLEPARSEFFQESDEEIFRLPDTKAVIAAAFGMGQGAMSDPVAGEDRVFLFRVVEIKEAREGTLEEVKDRIIAKLKPAEELKAAMKKAAELLPKLKVGELDLKKVAEDAKTEVLTTELTERYLVVLAGLGYSDTLGVELAAMNQDNPWPKNPVAVDKKVVITRLLETAPPDVSGFDKDKEFYERFLLSKKQNEVYEDFIEKLRGSRVTFTERWKEDYLGEKPPPEP